MSEIHNDSFRLRKCDILRKKSIMNLLFPNSNGVTIDVERYKMNTKTIRCTYIFFHDQSESMLQAMFSVSKKNFKHSVCRNLIRRRIKESYRLNKNKLILSDSSNLKIAIHFRYNQDEIFSYAEIDHDMQTILQEIADKYSHRNN